MIPFIKKYLFDNWQDLRMGKKPDDLLFIKLPARNIRAPELSIVSFLLKAVYKKKETPVLIVRFPRYAENIEANASLKSEYDNLNYLNSNVNKDEIKQVIPHPIMYKEINSTWVLAINYLPGQGLGERIISSDILKAYIENYQLSFSWLVGLQKELDGNKREPVKNVVERVIGQFEKMFPDLSIRSKDYFLKTRAVAEKHNMDIPIMIQHNDFHADNIFVLNNKISGVIDWEDCEREGIPGFDLLHFIKTYYEALLNYFAETNNISMIDSFLSNNQIINVIESTVESYFNAIGIDKKYNKIIIPLYLFKSAMLAGSSRKQASSALSHCKNILQLQPVTFIDLFEAMSVFIYGRVLKKALDENNQKLASECKERIKMVQKKLEKRAKESPPN